MTKTIVREGTGDAHPAKSSKVYVHYTGRLEDGTVFDSSRGRGEPFTFTLGTGGVIKGWDLGVATMRRGERAILRCQPKYAYGAAGSPPKIPPNATLEFDVELLRWVDGEELAPGITKKVAVAGEGWRKPKDKDEVVVEITSKDAAGAEGSCVTQSIVVGTAPEAWLDTVVKSMLKNEVATVQVDRDGTEHHYEVKLTQLHFCEDVTSDGAVIKIVDQEGEGYERANLCAKVVLNLRGHKGPGVDGPVFDERPGLNAVIGVGAQLPPVLEQAVEKMNKNERARVVLQPAYAAKLPNLDDPSRGATYEIELVSLEKAQETWQLNDAEARVAYADRYKEYGNEEFRAGRIDRALKLYESGLRAVEKDEDMKRASKPASTTRARSSASASSASSSDNEESNAAGAAPESAKPADAAVPTAMPVEGGAAGEAAGAPPPADAHFKAGRDVRLALFLNTAQCALKLNDPAKTITQCTSALKLEPDNVKALYRRGAAYKARAEYELAREDFLHLLHCDAQNATARAELRAVEEQIRAQRAKEKRVFGNLFQKLARLEEQEKQQSSPSDTAAPAATTAAAAADAKPVETHVETTAASAAAPTPMAVEVNPSQA